MKKTITQRFFLSLCLMIVGCLWGSSAWAETITLSQSTIGSLLGTGYASTDFIYSGITWGRKRVYKNNGGIQIEGGTSKALWNKTAIPGAITKIKVTQKTNASTLTVGTTTQPTTNSKSTAASSTATYEFNASDNYQYFKIAATSKFSVITSIEITYEAAGYPTFSLAAGTYYGNQTLELSTTVEGGTIYYTTDGKDPSESSTAVKYSAPITLTTTTTVKAVVMDGEGNLSSVVSSDYTIIPSIANTKETALTTTEAIALIDATSAAQLAAEKVYVKGTISKIDSYNSSNKSITYWLDDDKFEVYSGRGLDNAAFSAKTDIEVGAEVIIYGNIKKYSSTYEFDKNNYLVSYDVAAKTLESVTISGTPTQTTYEVGEVFNTAGLTVTASYSDGSSKEITSGITWNVTPETLIAGVTSVKVTATVDGKTSNELTLGVTVRVLESITLEGNPTKTSYAVGETFDPAGIIVKANYSNSDSEDVTAEATFDYDHSTLTTSTTSMAVTATYGGMTSAEQNYTITVLKTIVPFAPKVIYRKITSTADIVDGGVYLIVCEDKSEVMGAKNDDKKRCEGIQEVDLSSHTYTGTVNQSGSPYEITISKAEDESGYYNLYHAEGVYINSTTKADFSFGSAGDNGWSISFDASGNVIINNIKAPGYHIHRNSGTSNLYKNYDDNLSGGKEVQLYQKVGEISVAQATGGITTFASNYDYIMPENLTGYIVTAAAEAGTITTEARYPAGEEVPAYTPLIIKSREDYAEDETAKTYNPIALNRGLSYSGPNNMLEYNRDASGYTATLLSEPVYYYKLAIKDGNVGFYWGATGGAAFQMTKPSTAYLTVLTNSMPVQGFVLNLEEGETTGITTVVTDEDAPIYNLQGIRMNGKNLPKGIYIQGGKKFMVK